MIVEIDLSPDGTIPILGMIPVHMTIERRHHSWYVAACSVDFGNGITRLLPPTRSFKTETAAVNFMKRMVLRDLHRHERPETGTDIECQVKRLSLTTAAFDIKMDQLA